MELSRKSEGRRAEAGRSGRPFRQKVLDALRSPLLLPVLFVPIWLLGVIAFELSRDASHWLDSAYRSVQMFGFNFEMEPGWCSKSPLGCIHPVLQVARFLAAIFTVLAVAALFVRSLFEKVWFRRQCGRPAERRVLLGFGTVNHALARTLREKHPGMALVAVDKEFDEADRRVARAESVLLVSGDTAAPETLEDARLAESGGVFVSCGDDAVNIEVATAAARLVAEAVRGGTVSPGPGFPRELAARLPPSRFRLRRRRAPTVFAHLSSLRMVTDIQEARDSAFDREQKFQPFSLRTAAVRDLLDRARLTTLARDRKQDRVHLVLAGLGDQGEAVFAETLLTCYAQELKPPRITFIDRDMKGSRARLKALYPRLFDDSIPAEARPTLKTWIPADIGTLGFEDDARLDALERPDEPTAWVFACREDERNLDAALRLEWAMNALRRRPAPVFVRLWGARIAGEAPHDPLRFFQPFGDIRTTARRAPVLDKDADELPQRLHAFYLKVFGEWDKNDRKIASAADAAAALPKASGQSYRTDWEKLPENVRESSRRAAHHAVIKLADLGLQWRGMGEGMLPRIAPEDAEPFRRAAESFDGRGGAPAPGSAEQAMLEASKIEHARWMADRALSGWQQGLDEAQPGEKPKFRRDNRRRWQDSMIPFADLKAQTKALDMALLRAMLDYLTGEKAKGNPPAFPRREFQIAQDADAAPLPPRVDPGVTELVLSIGPEKSLVGESKEEREVREKEREEAIVRLAGAWARTAEAVRLQVRAERPLGAPPLRDFDHPEVRLAEFVVRLHEAVGPEILFDITPLYVVAPPRRHVAPPPEAKSADGG